MANKRIIRKLTDRVREKIRTEHRKLRKSDYDGEALTYLNRVRGAAKGRKAAKEKVAKVDDLVIPKDSEIYRIIEGAAKYKKTSVKKFIKQNRQSIVDLMQEGDFVFQRETDYLIEDIRHVKKGQSVLVNDGNGYRKTAPKTDIYNITSFTQYIFSNTEIFMLIYRVHRKLNGDLTHYLPPVDEYEELEESGEIEEMLDSYYPEITYLKSAKKNERDKKKEKVIAPYSKKRKGKGKSVNRQKRKATHKIPKTK